MAKRDASSHLVPALPSPATAAFSSLSTPLSKTAGYFGFLILLQHNQEQQQKTFCTEDHITKNPAFLKNVPPGYSVYKE